MLLGCSTLLHESQTSFGSEFGVKMLLLGPFEITMISHTLHKIIAHWLLSQNFN